MIPLPWLLFGLCIALFGTYRGGYHFGWSDRDKEMQIEIAKKNEESRQTEQKLTEKLNENASKLLEANNVLNQKTTALDRAIRDGRLRLNTSSCVQPTKDSTITATNSEKTGSESNRQVDQTSDSDRATLAAIAEIVAQGDRNAAQLNACIDAYSSAMDLVNGKAQ